MHQNDKSIVHMDLDTFFVSVERLIDSRLNNKPILIGGVTDRGVVASCSYEARVFGIHSAMPMKMARQLCPEAIVIKGNTANYTKYSHMVTDIIKEEVPLYEKTSIDEFYMDLSGMDRFFGCFKLASEIRRKIIRETGLPISFGQSVNKTVSKVATGEAKPNNQIKISSGTEKPFLFPLSVKKIPMVGDKTYQTLRNLGIKTIGTVQEMPVDLMETHYDEDSYKIHMNTAKEHTLNVAMVFVKRIMWDVDNAEDLKFLLEQKEKPQIAQKIKEILDNEIRPAIAMDGGDCEFAGFEDGILTLRLQGACSTCPSSVMTLKMGIENRLREDVPELKEVIQV